MPQHDSAARDSDPLFRTIVSDDWKRALRQSRGQPNTVIEQIHAQLPASPIAKPRRLAKHAVRFTGEDIAAAAKAWRCTCGPVAIACVLDLTLDEVRPFLGSDYKGWMSPTQMVGALRRAGVSIREHDRTRLYRPHGPRQWGCPVLATYGITRIQFDGPWLKPGAPPAAAYHYTHWVASSTNAPDGCADAHDNNWGWMSFGGFFANMSELAKEIPRASGEWWPTHMYEIDFPNGAPHV